MMKINQKELELLIDNFLKEDFDLIKEDYHKQLNEQPSGINTTLSWRYPDTGQECKLNITSLLTKVGIPDKPAGNINDAISFILSRFLGLNSWMCDIVNIALGVPRKSSDSSRETGSLSLNSYFEYYTEGDWNATFKNAGVKDAATFKSELISKIENFRNNAGINSVSKAKNNIKTSTFVELLYNDARFFKDPLFYLHTDKAKGIREIAINIKKSTSEENFYNNIIDDIITALSGQDALSALKDVGYSQATERDIKAALQNIKK